MNRNGKTTITALFAMFRAACGKCLDYLQKGEEKTIPWGTWAKYGLCAILLALFVPMCVKGYLLMWEVRSAYYHMPYGFFTGIYLCLLVLLAVLSMKQTPVSKPSWVWEALFWIILLFLAGISAITCFAFVTTLRILRKGLQRHPQDHKAENIPKSQSLDQKEIQVLGEEARQGVSFDLSSVVGLWEQMNDFLARGIGFFQRNPFHTAMIVTGLVILGAYWRSLPDYPLVAYDRSIYYTNALKPKLVDGKYGYADMYGKIVIAPVYDEVAPENPFFFMGKRPARIKINGKYGYINRKGKEVVPPRFDEAAQDFNQFGMAPVRIGNKWGWINMRGREIIPPRFDKLEEPFNEQTQAVLWQPSRWEALYRLLNVHPAVFDKRTLVKVMADGKWGYVNIRGKEIVPPRYDEIYEEKYISGNDVLALVREGDQWSWIGFDGKEITPAYLAEADAKNLHPIQFGDKWGYANGDMTVMILPHFNWAQDFRAEGKAIVMQDGEWVFIDASGEVQDHFPPLSEISGDVPEPFPFFRDGKWGYCAQNIRQDQECANVVISPRFDQAKAFPGNSNRAKVMMDGQWGYVNIIGKMVIPPQFKIANEFDKNGLAKVVRDGKWGYIDRFGKEIIPIRFDYVDNMDGNLVYVKQEDKFGFFNLEGKEIVPPRYDKVEHFDKTYALIRVWQNKKAGIINTEGKEIVVPRYDEIKRFEKNMLARVKLGSKWGIINMGGKEIVAPRYDGIESFNDGNQAKVQLDEKWGLVDTTGREIVAPRYDDIRNFDSNELAGVTKNGKWGYVDIEDKEVVVPRFDAVGYANTATGYEKVAINGKWGLIDLQGKEFLPLRFDLILDGYHVADDVAALTRKGTKWHWFDKKGKQVVPGYVRQAKTENLVSKQFFGAYGYVNEQGVVVIPPRFDEAEDFGDTLALVRLGDKWGEINAQGKTIISFR